MFFRVKFAVFAAALSGAVALGGGASAVTFDDLDIIGGDLYLVNETATTVTASGSAGSLEIENWNTYNAETYLDSIAHPSNFAGPSLGVTSVLNLGALSGLVAFVLPPGDSNWDSFDTYLSGDLIETRQVGTRVLEGLFLRTDDRTVPNFGDYLIIRFTTSTDLTAGGTYASSDIKIFGATEKVSGVPLPGAMVLMVSGIAGLAGLRRLKPIG